ncbi:MAG: NAD(P)H-binding protein [Candidatus Thermoplasmatota archaeon]
MRVLVTGVENPTGKAIVESLADAGHQVRAFGLAPGTNPFQSRANVEPFAGDAALGGSLEPVAAECQAVVHAANLDRAATAVTIESGTRYARFAAERELVEQLIVLMPVGNRSLAKGIASAETHIRAARVPHTLLAAETPEAAAAEVAHILSTR